MKWNCAYRVSFLLLVSVWALAQAAEADSAQLPIFFTAEPEDAILLRGENLALYCNVTTKNGEEANVTWFKEGEAIPSLLSRGSNLILKHDANRRKETGKREIDGYYYCVAQTKNIAIRSRNALVKLEHYERATTTDGSSFHLNYIVSATASGHVKNLHWKITCNSMEFTCPSQNRSMCPFSNDEFVTGRLTRLSFLRIDYNGLQGNFGCRKDNQIKLFTGTMPERRVFTKVFNYNGRQSVSRLYLQPRNLFKRRGDNVTVICHGSNLGNQYTWSKDHKPLLESSRVKMNNGTLFITNVTMQDAGTYTCQVGIGKIKRENTSSLSVYELPNVSFDNQHCIVSGSNITEVLFIRNGATLKRMPVNCSSVNLRLHLSTANEGMYQCLANSKYGSAQKSIYLANKILNETISVNVERPAHCSNYSEQVTLIRTTPKPATRHGSKTSSEDITINGNTPSTATSSMKATSTPLTDPSLGQANVKTTPSLSFTIGSVKPNSTGNSTETALSQANSATTQPAPTTAKTTASTTSTESTTASLTVSTTSSKTSVGSTGTDTDTGGLASGTTTTAAAARTSTFSSTAASPASASTTSGSDDGSDDGSGSISVQSTVIIKDDSSATTTSDATSPIVPATDGATEQSAVTNTNKVTTYADLTTSSLESTKTTKEMNQKGLTGIITIGAASGGIVLVLLVILIVIIACKRKRGHFPISTETAKRAHCRLTSNQSYIRTNSALLESAYATIPEDTAESGKIAPQMPGLESVVYATVDSCLPKVAEEEIPNSQDGADEPKSSHTSNYADVEKCCEGRLGCAAISHGEQQGSAIAHVSINGDDYAACQKETTFQKDSTETPSRESKVKHVTVGEDEYALCEKKAENQSKVPDHVIANGGDMYAVSMKSKEIDSSSTKENKIKRKISTRDYLNAGFKVAKV